MMDTKSLSHLAWIAVLCITCLPVGVSAEVPNQTGIIVGTIVGFMLLVCLVFAFIFLHAAVKRDRMTTYYYEEYPAYDNSKPSAAAQGNVNTAYHPSAPPPIDSNTLDAKALPYASRHVNKTQDTSNAPYNYQQYNANYDGPPIQNPNPSFTNGNRYDDGAGRNASFTNQNSPQPYNQYGGGGTGGNLSFSQQQNQSYAGGNMSHSYESRGNGSPTYDYHGVDLSAGYETTHAVNPSYAGPVVSGGHYGDTDA